MEAMTTWVDLPSLVPLYSVKRRLGSATVPHVKLIGGAVAVTMVCTPACYRIGQMHWCLQQAGLS